MERLSKRMIKKYNYLREIRQRLETEYQCSNGIEETAKNLKACLNDLSKFFKNNPSFYKSCTYDIDGELTYFNRDAIVYLDGSSKGQMASEISFSDAKQLQNIAVKVNDVVTSDNDETPAIVELERTEYRIINEAFGLIDINNKRYYSEYMAVRNSLRATANRWYLEVNHIISAV